MLDYILSKEIFLCLILFLILFWFCFDKAKKELRINQWQKKLNLKRHAQVFQRLYCNINGFMISRQARKNQDAIEYVYGEIEFLPFIALLSMVNIDDNTVFYDLGSGTGKAVVACAMVYPVRKSIGVELFPKLHQCACERLQELATMKGYAENSKKISFILGDFLTVDLSEATLIFINSSTLFGATWEALNTRINNLPQLSTVITTSKTLSSSHFKLVTRAKIQMSWGVVFAFIHKKEN
ncbi:TPA: methyltransferase [Legionella pneumophila]|nr:methyltransferase [Legionella pneumophila]MDW8878772.1 methyltransferase [Legionella pneumophila subsp. fraseri]MDW8963394.1 methyltransferase [Legionella pneumophila subsp. fraseri]MDW9035496.1 methyltransferase [Legionella pneumophila subsp. fraseri]MDW9038557.1 methyltransferase [Legionella pneumophila subsp. fraseri]MDW9041618.1 methyltransferase [Legionella pneumophila subsp. fraseri]